MSELKLQTSAYQLMKDLYMYLFICLFIYLTGCICQLSTGGHNFEHATLQTRFGEVMQEGHLVLGRCEPWKSLQPKFHLFVKSRHVTTRYLAHALGLCYRKQSYVLCRACCTASATCPSPRARQARYST